MVFLEGSLFSIFIFFSLLVILFQFFHLFLNKFSLVVFFGIQVLVVTLIFWCFMLLSFGVKWSFKFCIFEISSGFELSLGFILDELSLYTTSLVFLISIIVQSYAFYYMKFEDQSLYFQFLLGVFTLMMVLFVVADNLLLAFAAWEGLGFISFLLINFWSLRLEANKAAVKAMVFNRTADMAFVLGLGLSMVFLRTWDFETLNFLSNENYNILLFNKEISVYDLLAICLCIAAMGKSAQLGFHSWLVAAMEGPSPVSALLHSATMVAAGILLLLRCQGLFSNISIVILCVLSFWGALTFCVTSFWAVKEADLKKIIAYSTCSHLGLLFMLVGLNFTEIAVVHLNVHAFFKTSLFLCAGAFMMYSIHLQNMYKLMNVGKFLPLLQIMVFVSGISLLGFPYSLGALSKERIVILFLHSVKNEVILDMTIILFLLGQIFALIYTLRLIYMLGFKNFYSGDRSLLFLNFDEKLNFSLILLIVTLGLFVLAPLVQYHLVTEHLFFKAWFWAGTLVYYPTLTINWVSWYVQLYLPLLMMVFFFFWKYGHKEQAFYKPSFKLGRHLNLWSSLQYRFNSLLNNYFFLVCEFEILYLQIINRVLQSLLKFSLFFLLRVERGFAEIEGPIGLVRIMQSSFALLKLQSGSSSRYIETILVILLLYFSFMTGLVFFQ